MAEIGSADYALFIKEQVRANMNDWSRPNDYIEENPPEGWEFLGRGSFRSTWRGPDGVAYKVQHRPTSMQTNQEEYQNLQKAAKIEAPEGTRLPACSFYPLDNRIDGVIAMECVDGATIEDRFGRYGPPSNIAQRVYAIEDKYRLGDMHFENVMIEDETDIVIPIDFGC